LSRIFLSIYATVEMNTDIDPVGTAVPGEIPGEKERLTAKYATIRVYTTY